MLERSFTFHLDALPVNFEPFRTVGQGNNDSDEVDASPRSRINEAAAALRDIIWEEGGFRFRHKGTNFKTNLYCYNCSQDEAHVPKYEPTVAEAKQRDRQRMERFSCGSKLSFRPCFQERTLSLSICHKWHTPYEDIRISSGVRKLIEARVSTKTPSEIWREIRDLPEADGVTRHQIYYVWQKANSELWQRNPDPLTSAAMLLHGKEEYSDQYKNFQDQNVRALGFYVSETITKVAGNASQLLMDATYGTNNSGLSLVAVLTEVDGIGVPLAYCFVKVEGSRKADAGATTRVLELFLRELKKSGLDPRFFALDKDQAEMSAVDAVWPGIKIQLCYWHVKRAVSMKLNESKKTQGQMKYRPEEAQELIPGLEVCWGALPIRRPVEHRFGRCQCESHQQSMTAEGRLELLSKEEKVAIIGILCLHFNLHPLIPDHNGTFKTSSTIHRESATEMYTWCRIRGYPHIWGYLWRNWYAKGQWELWARAASHREVPVVKTTMMVESHWRTLKHDYLHRFNRPRVDLVVWILISRAIPDVIHRMEAISKGIFRVYKARWREAFKRQWKHEKRKLVNGEKMKEHHTDPVNWVCACKSFLCSRFLLCKHIVHCFKEPHPNFYLTVKRQMVYPFWKDQKVGQLELKPEYEPRARSQSDKELDEENPGDGESASDFDSSDPESSDSDSDDEEQSLESFREEYTRKFRLIADTIEDQAAKGATEWRDRFVPTMTSVDNLADDIEGLSLKRTMPGTWVRHKHPATMYQR
ncbi:ATP-dependent DNA helicase PIF1 [Penicillium sp. DV-2018c]|nr:ATP-dependent DNA helicase PIF1 [Penicillium sp. DV-2018c]